MNPAFDNADGSDVFSDEKMEADVVWSNRFEDDKLAVPAASNMLEFYTSVSNGLHRNLLTTPQDIQDFRYFASKH